MMVMLILNIVYVSLVFVIVFVDCVGVYVGNDGFYLMINFGYVGDGLLNGGVQVVIGEVLFLNFLGVFIMVIYLLYDFDGDG